MYFLVALAMPCILAITANAGRMGRRVRGAAYLDAATGQVTAAETTFDLDMDTELNGKNARLSAALQTRLRRAAEAPPPE